MKNTTKKIVVTTLLTGIALTGLLPIVTHATTPNTKIVQTQQNHRQTIEQTMTLAKQGKTINSENFAIGSNGSDIKKKWGKPTSGDSTYLKYEKKKIMFLLSDGKVSEILSEDKRYEKITYDEVKQVLGNPKQETKGEDAIYVRYLAGKHQIDFAFNYDKTGKKADTLKAVVLLP
ncbi:DUF4309 domain-containing protein [Shimazuella kribbensis]|uniref:DUF4309 domain-containing protein n=1 Tax=Shimazuella kribbensis TaxID=139808 RepID=UPI00041B6114|nr:DUF4309 domain-containing protein [Shimazuella kribbensis]